MLMIWIVAALMVLIASAVFLRDFWAVRTNVKSAELDVQVYKDQLAALEVDLERGVIASDAYGSAKVEISRRLLAADKRASTQNTAPRDVALKPVGLAVVAVMFAGSLGLYGVMGKPKLPDQPLVARLEAAKIARSNRLTQSQAESKLEQLPLQAEPEYLALIEKLRTTMETREGDVEGWKLLSLHESRIGNFRAAWRAQEKVIALSGDKATGTNFEDLAEFMVVATNGYVSVEAEQALAKALRLDPTLPRARYYSGLALAQNGRADVAYRMWVGLLEEGPADAPWVALIRGQIGKVARAAGINPANIDAPGPNAQQVEDAQQMSEADRKEMIRGMVGGLAERLATQGGGVNDWARLIRAYGVLGETANASAIWNEAKGVFSKDAQAMALLREAAVSAEVAN